MAKIVDIDSDDLRKYREIFSRADYLGMTSEEAVKLVNDDGSERILFVCGSIWMLFSYLDKKIQSNTFLVNDDKIFSFTKDDYQVNIYDNMIYLIYENGKHESLQLLKNSENPEFDVNSNGIVVHMQYDIVNDMRCVSKYEHCVYGNCNRIYDMRLNIPYEVSIEKSVSKRDRGFKFIGSKSSYYRLDFDVRDNKWRYDLSTISEYGVGAVIASDTITLHNGEKKFSRFCRKVLSVGNYITITGFPFMRQYTEKDIKDYVVDNGFNYSVSDELIHIFNNREKYTRDFEDIMLLYKSRMIAHHSIYR